MTFVEGVHFAGMAGLGYLIGGGAAFALALSIGMLFVVRAAWRNRHERILSSSPFAAGQTISGAGFDGWEIVSVEASDGGTSTINMRDCL